jgi:hypothetical protein
MTTKKAIDSIRSRLDKIALKGKDNYLEYSNYFKELSVNGNYDNLLQCLSIYYLVDVDKVIINLNTFKKNSWKNILIKTDSSINKKIKKLYDSKKVYQTGFDIWSSDPNSLTIVLSDPLSSTFSSTNLSKGISFNHVNTATQSYINMNILNNRIYKLDIQNTIWDNSSKEIRTLSATFSPGNNYSPGTYSNVRLQYNGGTYWSAPTGQEWEYPTAEIVVGTGGTVSSVTLKQRGVLIPDTTTRFGVQTGTQSYKLGTASGTGFSIGIATIDTLNKAPSNINNLQSLIGSTQSDGFLPYSSYRTEMSLDYSSQFLVTTYERARYDELGNKIGDYKILNYKLELSKDNYLGQIIEAGIYNDESKYLLKNREFARITKTRKTFLEVVKFGATQSTIIVDQDDLRLSEDNNLYNRYVIAINLLLS